MFFNSCSSSGGEMLGKSCPIPLKPWETSRQVRCRGTHWVVNSDSALLKRYEISVQCLHVLKMQFHIFERFHSSSLQQYLSSPQEQALPAGLESHLPTANTNSLWNKQSSQWDLQALEQVQPAAGWHSHLPTHTQGAQMQTHLQNPPKSPLLLRNNQHRQVKLQGFFMAWQKSL